MSKRLTKKPFPFYYTVIFIFIVTTFETVANNNSTEITQKPPTVLSAKIADENEARKKTNAEEKMNDDWMHSFHSTVSDSVYQSALWFDGFFTHEENEQQTPKTTARIRFSWEPKSRDLAEFNSRFRVKVQLPHLKNKFDLILSDDSDDELSQLPLETIKPKSEISDEPFAAAVRMVHLNTNEKYTDTRVGLSGGDVFLKTRHKRRYSLQDVHGFKIEPSVFYFLDDGLGARLLLEYDYQLNPKEQLRVNYSVRGSESYSGIRWKHGFYHLRQLSDNRAAVLGLLIQGERNGDNGFLIENYTLSYRYRFNALKKWLFFEIEPFIEWPDNENYKTTPGIALRVEGYFSKK